MLDYKVKQSIVASPLKAIPKTMGDGRKKVMPGRDKKCKEAVGNTNKAFREVERTHNFQHLIQFKKAQTTVRRTIRPVKGNFWRQCCDSMETLLR